MQWKKLVICNFFINNWIKTNRRVINIYDYTFSIYCSILCNRNVKDFSLNSFFWYFTQSKLILLALSFWACLLLVIYLNNNHSIQHGCTVHTKFYEYIQYIYYSCNKFKFYFVVGSESSKFKFQKCRGKLAQIYTAAKLAVAKTFWPDFWNFSDSNSGSIQKVLKRLFLVTTTQQ